jgi:hypothetical protein
MGNFEVMYEEEKWRLTVLCGYGFQLSRWWSTNKVGKYLQVEVRCRPEDELTFQSQLHEHRKFKRGRVGWSRTAFKSVFDIPPIGLISADEQSLVDR